MSLLTMVQSTARRIGIPTPSVVATATDPTVLALLELAQEEGRQLARFGDWQILRKEQTFTTVAAETQTGTLPTDWAGFIDDTIWNRSAHRRLFGPVSPQQWQEWKARSAFPVTDTFCIRGGTWLMNPTPAASQTVAYEYRSSYWCQSSGNVAQEAWAADTDTGLLSERLMGLGLIWRYKQTRGLDWQTDYDKYLFEVNQALATDQPRRIVDMKNENTYKFGISVPDMSWNL